MMGRGPSSLNKCENFQVAAAFFADGTVSGDFRWINAIASERRWLFQDIGKATDILTKAIIDSTNLTATIQQLTEWKQSEGGISQPGMATPTPIDSNGSTSRSLIDGKKPDLNFVPPPRPFARGAVAAAAIWLLSAKEETLPAAIATLGDWRDRLGPWDSINASSSPPTIGPGGPKQPMSERPPSQWAGKPAPDFVLKDVNGQEVALKDLRGKTVLLDFWATWCEPCRAAMPDIKAAYDNYHDKGLVVVGIDFSETAEKAKKYFEEQKEPFVNLLDPDKKTFQAYGGGGIPKVVLIDKDGIIRDDQQGYSSGEDFSAVLKKLGL